MRVAAVAKVARIVRRYSGAWRHPETSFLDGRASAASLPGRQEPDVLLVFVIRLLPNRTGLRSCSGGSGQRSLGEVVFASELRSKFSVSFPFPTILEPAG